MYSVSNFSTKPNESKLEPISLENINGIYVPLKQKDNNADGYKIENIEGMRDFNIQNFININQKIDKKVLNERDLVLNDNIFSRVFVGGISFLGLYSLYILLYKMKNN